MAYSAFGKKNLEGSIIQDLDQDTKVQVEESADEDIIRFDTAGSERGNIDEDGIITWPDQSCVAIRAGSQLNIANDTATKVELDLEDLDRQNEFDPTTNYRYTASKAGIYLVTTFLYWAQGSIVADKQYDLMLYKNGVYNRHTSFVPVTTGSTNPAQTISAIYSLSVNDYIELFVLHNAGVGTVDVQFARFEVVKIA